MLLVLCRHGQAEDWRRGLRDADWELTEEGNQSKPMAGGAGNGYRRGISAGVTRGPREDMIPPHEKRRWTQVIRYVFAKHGWVIPVSG